MGMVPFSSVVSDHGPTVLRVCRAMLEPTEADDAWSETFLAALRAYPDLARDANVAGWLVTIARNKCTDMIRRRNRAAIPVADGLDTVATDDRPHTPDAELRRALATLSDRQQTAVIAHHVAGMPYAEVATLLGTTPAAARRSAADGIAKLRSTYREDAPE